jgi:RNA polymerase sigma-70 factor (ECF subfamily)
LKASIEPWPVRISSSAPGTLDAPTAAIGQTLAQIYDAHFDFVWRNACRLGVPEASADDVVQDVFMVVQRRLGDFNGRVQMRAWIFGILVRVARGYRRSFRRKAARCVPFEQEASYDTSEAQANAPTPIDLAERAERVRLLNTLLDQLDEDKRALLILSELEQCTLREIAVLLDSNTNTIYSRLRAARQAFDKVYARSLASKRATP